MFLAVCLIVIINGLLLAGNAWDYLWGKWEEKRNPANYFIFTPTNLTVSVNGTQQVWQVLSGTNLIMGLRVKLKNQELDAGSTVKFNEMIFHLGTNIWLLRQSGVEYPDFQGAIPNDNPINHEIRK